MISPLERIEPALRREHLLRTGSISLVVGTWLTLYNQGGKLLAGTFDTMVVVALVLNYLTPFVVANWGLLSRQS